MRRMGFTLVELLVVVAILAVLLSTILPSLHSAKESTRRVMCGSNLHQLAVAHKTYETRHLGTYPRARDYLTTEAPQQGSVSGIPGYPTITTIPSQSILVLGGYLSGGEEVFRCPSDDMERSDCAAGIRAILPGSFSYTRNGAIAGVGPAGYLRNIEIRRPGDTTMLLEEWEHAPMNDSYVIPNSWDLITQRHNGEGAMAFFDGHARCIDAETFNLQSPLWRAKFYLDP